MKRPAVSQRALVVAPRGRDAVVAASILVEAGVEANPCASLPELIEELHVGAGVVVITEEALATADIGPLAAWIADQPDWSDLPFVLLTSHGGGIERNPVASRYLALLGNASFIERPFHPTTLISQVRAALRGRHRQYEARARLDSLRLVATLDEVLRTTSNAANAMGAAAELLGRRIGASRCAYADVDADNDRFVIRNDYAAQGIATSIGTYSLDLFGARAATHLRAGQTLMIRDVADELAPGDGREMFLSIGIGAIVCCPLVKGGRLVAMMAVHQDGRREWQSEEIAIVETVVERCWAHIERVGAEARLRESEGRYRTLFESVESGFCILEMISGVNGRASDYRYIEVNPAFERQSGLKNAEGKRVRELVPDLEERWFARFRHVALTGEPMRVEDEAASLERWFDVNAFRIGEPTQHRVALHFTDVTARRNLNAQLRQSEQRLRELNETLETAVIARTAERNLLATIVETTDAEIQALDLEYRWLAINSACADAYERIYGKRPHVGQSLLELLSDDPEQQAAARAVWSRALAGEAYSVVGEFGDPAHGRRSYDMKFETLRRSDGSRIGAFLTGVDITERVQERSRLAQAEDALRQAQKMEAVGQLTGGVAHDFNNFLTIIKSSTDLLRRPDLPDERRRRYVDAIADTVDKAAKLTGQLLAFARRQALKPEVFDAAERIRGITEMLATIVGSRIQVVTELPVKACHVEADVSQFETALVNMAINARDAMRNEGVLTVKVERVPALPVSLTVDGGKPERYIAVSIRDTGAGILADQLAHIFEPFYTTKEVGKGTGLGLSQVHGFARQSGGDIAVDSKVGDGACFTLYLPEFTGQIKIAKSTTNEDAAPVRKGQRRRVLVVEDNIEVGTFSTQLLQDLGYETTWACNAQEALKLLEAGNGFDVVFSDVVMPGMSGVELGREIRRRYPALPIVLTSGYSHILVEEGHHGFELLKKPYAAEELSRVLRRVTNARGAKRLTNMD